MNERTEKRFETGYAWYVDEWGSIHKTRVGASCDKGDGKWYEIQNSQFPVPEKCLYKIDEPQKAADELAVMIAGLVEDLENFKQEHNLL